MRRWWNRGDQLVEQEEPVVQAPPAAVGPMSGIRQPGPENFCPACGTQLSITYAGDGRRFTFESSEGEWCWEELLAFADRRG